MNRSRVGYAFAIGAILAALVGFSLALYDALLRMRFDLPGRFLQVSMLVLLGFLLLLIVRYFGLLWFSYLAQLDVPEESETFCPLVTILVPAFNEGPVIQASIRSLLKLDYRRFEILVIDDGSIDDTYHRARAFEGRHGHATVRVIRKENGGKARALNAGLAAARGSLVLCMDGDSTLHPQTLRRAVPYFNSSAVGAVAGNVKVVNRNNIWTRLQALEYIEGLNMVRRAQGFFRVVNIVPGPIGLFRKSALEQIGGYDPDTFAEDCDLTLKLLVQGWQVHFEAGAIAYTEAPETLQQLLKQRYRWTRGILQAVRKHRRSLIDPRLGVSVSFTLWYMIFEGLLWPSINVFAHGLFIFVAATHGVAVPLVLWWAQLTVLDLAAALYCVIAEEEEIGIVPYAVLYRAFFALLIDTAKLLASFEELLQTRMDWGKLERLGRI